MTREEAKVKFNEAERLFAERQYQPALDLLTELDREYPNQRHILYPMARCLAGLRRLSEAMDLSDRIVRDFEYGPAKELKDRLKDKHSRISSMPPISSMSSFDPPASKSDLPESPKTPTPKPVKRIEKPLRKDKTPEPAHDEAPVVAEHDEVRGPAPVAYGVWAALIVLGFGLYTAIGATAAQPALAFTMNADDAQAETPWQALMILWVGLAVHLYLLACLPQYVALRVVGALRGETFKDDLLDTVTYTLYAFLLAPIVVVGWFIYFVLLRRGFELSTGETARAIAVFVALFTVVSLADWAILQFALNPVLAGL